MLTTIEKIRMICEEKHIPISKLESDCGWSNGYLNPKRMKNLPSDRLQAAAEYLNMSVNDILTYGEEKPAPTNEDGLDDNQRQLIKKPCTH